MMKRKLAALLLAMMMAATACGQTTGTNSNTGTDSQSAADTVKEDSGNESQENSQTETGKTVTVSENGQAVVKTVGTAASVISDKYSNRDKNASWSQTGSTQITFNGNDVSVTGNGAALTGNQLIISAEGTYVLSGNWSDGQIIVEAADTAKVQIVLNGADITSQTGSVLQIKTADKVFLTLADGTVNQMTDAESYADTSETAADAAIYNKTDLTINGGTMTVNAADDTLHSNGSITIQAGSLTLTSGDDGIHAETDLNITGSAVIDVTNSVEGLEAKVVNISGGTVNVNASDDGINATGGTSSDGGFGGGMDQVQEGVAVNISGGVITVNAQGDGLDSNGNVTVSGGTTVIYGPTNNGNGSLDYNGTADISGGTFIAAGSSGMYQGFSQNSSQSSVAFYHNGSADEQLTLADSAGNVIASFPGVKNYQVVLISTGRLKTGTSYTVYTGGTLSEAGSGVVTGSTIKNGTAVMTVTAE